MQMCSRCHKRVAVVFVSKTENNDTTTEGLCLPCAKELGLPINNALANMNLPPEMLEELQTLTGDDNADGGAPAIDFPKLFQNIQSAFGTNGQKNTNGDEKGKEQPKTAPQKSEGKYLSGFCHNLTEDAKNGKLDRIVGRERELERVIQILCRRQKNNPCLIGEPGVGKTAIAEALALRIASGNVPYRLQNSQVYLMDLTALVAGTQFRGQFESRVLGLLKEVKAAGDIILVIDEVHNIVGGGDSEGGMNAANIMKPALSRGEIQVIGATTLKEYRKYIEKDAALERRFQPITVKEPSIAESVEMLKGIKDYYEKFHGIHIPDNVVATAVRLSERYITDRFLPDKAIDLLDEASARVSLSSAPLNELRRLRAEHAEVLNEKARIESMPETEDSLKMEEKFRLLADIKSRELRLSEKEDAILPEAESVTLTLGDLARVIEIWTGIPATSVSEAEFEHLEGLSERLAKRIVGQDEAINAVCRAIKRKRAGVSAKKSPVSFIFAGPTGVGKTELVKVLSEDLFREPESLIRLDMSEFMEKHSVSRIIGAPPGYVGFDEAGQLTEKIRRRPYSVVLFDEIEKAHPDVLNILLQVLDDGHITDAGGREINFENTVIVMTTNAGSEKASSVSGFAQATDRELSKDKTMRALSDFLRPEFINRVNEIITFAHLTPEHFLSIADIQLADLGKSLEEHGIRLTYTDDVKALVAKESYSEKFGARNMRRYIERNIEDPIAEEMIASYKTGFSGIHLTAVNGAIQIQSL